MSMTALSRDAGFPRAALRRLRTLARRAWGRSYYHRLLISAYLWRRLMLGTRVIAITGSAGKTTTTACLARILATRSRTHATNNNDNGRHGVLRTVLAMRPWHRYAVIEVGTDHPGMIARQARVVKPHVSIVLRVARAHMSSFKTLESVAEEKSQLVRHLSRRHRAILNGDDPLVRAMAGRCKASVSYFGTSSDCEVVTDSIEAAWPDRLSMTCRAGNQRARIRTQLVGTHWASSVSAAVAGAVACGVSLAQAARALAAVAPPAGRLQPVLLPSGAVVVRDEGVASPDSLVALFEVMRQARAGRRWLLVGDVNASTQKPRVRQRSIGRMAAETCERAIFVGRHSHHAAQAALAAGMPPEHCWELVDVEAAAGVLRQELQAGDVLFVKGRTEEHLTRAVLAQFGSIGCWRDGCGIRGLCDGCPKLQPDFDVRSALDSAAAALQPADEQL